jgi:hypothetical protein
MDDTKQYKYYKIGDASPVRVVFNVHGLKMGAEAPDAATGALHLRMDLLSRIETSPDAEEIDRTAFESLCAGIYAKKKHDHSPRLTM